MSNTETATKKVRKPRILPFVLALVALFILGMIFNPYNVDGMLSIVFIGVQGFIQLLQIAMVVVIIVQIVRRFAATVGTVDHKKVLKGAKTISMFTAKK